MEKRLKDALIAIVGKENFLDSIEDRICYSYDATNQKYLPDAVAFPGSTQEVSGIMKIASRDKIPVIPRGAGTGFTGGSLPVQGGIVMVMTRMNRIIEIDNDNLIAVVEPGVITGKFQKEVARSGLFYPPDPASLEYSTLGGNVAECSGGPRAVKYGVTRDYVLGLEAVLPTGEIIHTGARTMKSVAGYELTRLLVGSEGTLAVITKIILRLIPLPEAVRTMLAIFPEITQAAKTVSEVIRSRIIPSTLEFMDNATIRCVEDYLHMGLPVEAGALLLIEVDGEKEIIEKQVSKIDELCRKGGAERIEIARDEAEQEMLWKARRSISAAIVKLNPTKVNEDIVVPRSKVPDIINALHGIAEKYQLVIVNFGHAGDGNIHVNIMTNRKNKDEMERVEKAVEEIFRTTLNLGGTISGEHGIGITKAPYLKWEVGDTGIEVMKRIKASFDPNNLR
ncbi:MAG: FAD-binding protein [Proteobacteria bacterium]|nr:FAD-binding protein [Pseudomonadota bacterium]